MHEKLAPPSPARMELAMSLARAALDGYQRMGIDTRGDLTEHADRVIGGVDAFAGKLLHPLAFVAVILHDIVDRFWNEDSPKFNEERSVAAHELASEAVRVMGLTEEEAVYLSALLNDLVGVEIASGAHRKGVANEVISGSEVNGLPKEIIEMISDSYQGEIPSEVWLATEPYLDFDHMYNMLYEKNIESFIIKAAELVDNMANPSSNRESALFQDVLEAESFYAPILEVLGFDGLASVLRSYAHRRRLISYDEAKGREQIHDTKSSTTTEESGPSGAKCIGEAELVIEKIENIGMEKVAQHIFGDNRLLTQPAVGEDHEGNVPIQIGDLLMDWHGSEISLGRYRLKTVGSLASKMHNKGGVTPMDIVGMTVVSGDVRESARAFVAFMTERVDCPESGLLEHKADSKERPFFVSGSTEHIGAVKQELRLKGVDEKRVQFEEKSSEYANERGQKPLEVSKITFFATIDGIQVPTEVQFVTQGERERMRTGDIAHIIYKYLKQLGDDDDPEKSKITNEQRRRIIESAVKVLASMHARKQHLNPESLEVNERSLTGAQSMRYALGL